MENYFHLRLCQQPLPMVFKKFLKQYVCGISIFMTIYQDEEKRSSSWYISSI